jgi:hypothetical protein
VLQVNVFLNAGHSNYATKNAHPPTNTTTTTTITTVAGKHKEQNVLCIFEVGHQRSYATKCSTHHHRRRHHFQHKKTTE